MTTPNHTIGKLLAAIVRRHPTASFGIITHKKSLGYVRSQLPPGLKPKLRNFSAQRGSNDFVDVDVLVVLGSPKINPDAIRTNAIRLFGRDVPEEKMTLQWREVSGRNGVFSVEVRWYQSHEMRAAYAYSVTNELHQALGRARHIERAKTIYMLSNEPLDGVGGVEFVTNEDLIGADGAPRSDSLYPAVEALVRDRFGRGLAVGVQDLIQAFPGKWRTTLSGHLARAARGLGGVRQGRQWTPSSGVS